MQALESKVLVLKVFINGISMCVLELHFFILGNYWSLSGHEIIDLFSIFDSADHTLTLNNLLQFIEADFVNLICLHCLFKESLHLVSLPNGVLIHRSSTLLLNQKVLVDLISSEFDNWNIFFIIFGTFLSFICFFSLPVGPVGKTNQNEEENESKNALPNFNILIKQDDPEPDVSP